MIGPSVVPDGVDANDDLPIEQLFPRFAGRSYETSAHGNVAVYRFLDGEYFALMTEPQWVAATWTEENGFVLEPADGESGEGVQDDPTLETLAALRGAIEDQRHRDSLAS